VWIAAVRRRWLWGVATAAVAVAVLIVDVRWIIPAYRGAPYPHLARYAAWGGSLAEIVAGILRRPLSVVATVASGDRLVYVLALLAPLVFLPVLAPAEILPAAPALVQNLLASDPILHHHRTQYQAFVVPFLLTAAIAGYARLSRPETGRWPVSVLVVAFILSLALASRTVNNLAVARWWPTPEQRAAYAVLARVPPDAAVSAHDRYVPHLSLRPRVFVFPVGLDATDHVLLDLAVLSPAHNPDVTVARTGPTATISSTDGNTYRYVVIADTDRHLLLRRD
jgi:uncharacterized membrane protein